MVTHKQRAEDSPKIVFSFIFFSNPDAHDRRARQFKRDYYELNPFSRSRMGLRLGRNNCGRSAALGEIFNSRAEDGKSEVLGRLD